MDWLTWKNAARVSAMDAGFSAVGFSGTEIPFDSKEAYSRWLAADYHGEMAYMEKHAELRRAGAEALLPGAKTAIVFAASYGQNETDISDEDLEPSGKIARYALGLDYHYVLRAKIQALVDSWSLELPDDQWRICIDSAPLLERTYAVMSGIGFIGRNTMVILPGKGSYFFLAVLLTTAEITADEPGTGTCGTCTRCLDACPTSAFPAPGVLDARKCISYLTIEKKTVRSEQELAAQQDWIFGCDVCQEVCPYNKFTQETPVAEFREGLKFVRREPLSTFLSLPSNRAFERRAAESPLLRPGIRRLRESCNAILRDKKMEKIE